MNENKVTNKESVCVFVCVFHSSFNIVSLQEQRRGLFTAGKIKNATTTWKSFSCPLKKLTLQSSLFRLLEVKEKREKAAQLSSVVFMTLVVVFVHVAFSSFTSHLFFCSST